MVRIVNGSGEFQAAIAVRNKLVVVDFFASWCGPCRRIAPAIELLAEKYKNVDFVKIQQDTPGNEDVFSSQSIRAFPTFRFYLNGNQVDEMVGADERQLESKIQKHMTATTESQFQGKGVSLGTSQSLSVSEAREKRLRQLEALPQVRQVVPTNPSLSAMAVDDDDDPDAAAIQQALIFSTSGQSSSQFNTAPTQSTQMTQTTQVAVDESILSNLTDMGFPEDISRQALAASNNSLDAAIEYIEAVQNGDQPQTDNTTSLPSASVEPELSLDEKRRIYEEKLTQRRQQKENEENEAKSQLEKNRRKDAQTAQATRQGTEDAIKLARKAEAEQKRLDEQYAKRERERILSDISSRHPNLVSSAAAASKEEPVPREEQVSRCITLLKGYRLNEQGTTSLRLITTIVSNIVNSPNEEKFKTLKLDNSRIKTQIASLAGGLQLLLLAGFRKEEDRLIMGEVDTEWLNCVVAMLQDAL